MYKQEQLGTKIRIFNFYSFMPLKLFQMARRIHELNYSRKDDFRKNLQVRSKLKVCEHLHSIYFPSF